MKKFYIKIKSAGMPTFWYEKYIGEVFEVTGVTGRFGCEFGRNNFFVNFEGDKETYLVDWLDCELAEKPE
jgi:hypothetical protein